MPRRRVDLREAAEILGTSVDTVREQIQRGTLESEKEDGKVYVWLDTGLEHESSALISAKDETITVLREQLEAERAAHSEARRLLATALERNRTTRLKTSGKSKAVSCCGPARHETDSTSPQRALSQSIL